MAVGADFFNWFITGGKAIKTSNPKIMITPNNSASVNPFFMSSPIFYTHYNVFRIFCKQKKKNYSKIEKNQLNV